MALTQKTQRALGLDHNLPLRMHLRIFAANLADAAVHMILDVDIVYFSVNYVAHVGPFTKY